MLAAVVCFVSVLSTTSLASFGLDAATIRKVVSSRTVIMTGADEDIVRIEDRKGCLLFPQLFAAAAVLVCIVYYAIVKLTLLGMGAVVMRPPKPHPMYAADDDTAVEVLSADADGSNSSAFSVSEGEEEGVDVELKEYLEEHVEVAEHGAPQQQQQQQVVMGMSKTAIAPSSDCLDDEIDEEEVGTSMIPPLVQERQERFSSLKIWTNIYGLSLGIYCLVYSLLLPNELSAFVFCAATLLAGVHETAVPCLMHYWNDCDDYVGTQKRRRTRRHFVLTQKIKRCVGWICLFPSSIASEAVGTGRRRRRSSSSSSSSSNPLIRSGVLWMPMLIVVIAAGLACKLLASSGIVDGSSSSSSSMSMKVWDNSSGMNTNSTDMADYDWQNAPSEDEDAKSNPFTIDRVFDVLFPIVGVLMLKCMEKVENVRETMELAVPMCGVNCLCVVSVILMVQGPGCLAKHFEYAVVDVGNAAAAAAPDLPVLNDSSIERHMQYSTRRMEPKYQPILAALVLPFPLVCCIVCIVAAGRNHRLMVSFFGMFTKCVHGN